MRREEPLCLDLLEEIALVPCGGCSFGTIHPFLLKSLEPVGVGLSLTSLIHGVRLTRRRLACAHAVIALSACQKRCAEYGLQSMCSPDVHIVVDSMPEEECLSFVKAKMFELCGSESEKLIQSSWKPTASTAFSEQLDTHQVIDTVLAPTVQAHTILTNKMHTPKEASEDISEEVKDLSGMYVPEPPSIQPRSSERNSVRLETQALSSLVTPRDIQDLLPMNEIFPEEADSSVRKSLSSNAHTNVSDFSKSIEWIRFEEMKKLSFWDDEALPDMLSSRSSEDSTSEVSTLESSPSKKDQKESE